MATPMNLAQVSTEATTGSTTTATPRLIDELNALHDHYAQAINSLDTQDTEGAAALAAAYDEDAVQLIAEREGLTHLLPLLRGTPDTPLRRLVARFKKADDYTLWAFNPATKLDHRRRHAS